MSILFLSLNPADQRRRVGRVWLFALCHFGEKQPAILASSSLSHSIRSGQLNAKQRELAELQALAQRRLKGARANFAEGMQAARETRRDLEYTQKKMS